MLRISTEVANPFLKPVFFLFILLESNNTLKLLMQSQFIKRDGFLGNNSKGQLVMNFENIDNNVYQIFCDIKEYQDIMNHQFQKYVLKIERLQYNPIEKQLFVVYQDQNNIQYINKVEIIDQKLKYQLLNQAYILLEILTKAKKRVLGLTSQNIFLNGDQLVITFFSTNLNGFSQQSHFCAISQVLQEIVQHKSYKLPQKVEGFYFQIIQQLTQENVQINFSQYQSSYQKLKNEFINMQYKEQFRSDLPSDLFEISEINNQFSGEYLICSKHQIESQIGEQSYVKLENKMINEKMYIDQSKIFIYDQDIKDYDENYYYYLDFESLKKIDSRLQVSDPMKNQSKKKKVMELIDIQQEVFSLLNNEKVRIPNFQNLNHSMQYYALKHMQDQIIQMKRKDLLTRFNQNYKKYIEILNGINEQKFEFNQIVKEVDNNYYFKSINEQINWSEFQLLDQNLKRLLQYFQVKKNALEIIKEEEVKEYFKNIPYNGFRFRYEQKFDEQHQIGYAVDNEGNYYKGVFQNKNLKLGDILSISNNLIKHYEGVSKQQNVIFGKECQLTVYQIGLEFNTLEDMNFEKLELENLNLIDIQNIYFEYHKFDSLFLIIIIH